MHDLFLQLAAMQDAPRAPRCRHCSNAGDHDDGRPCFHCTDGVPNAPAPFVDDDPTPAEVAELKRLERHYMGGGR